EVGLKSKRAVTTKYTAPRALPNHLNMEKTGTPQCTIIQNLRSHVGPIANRKIKTIAASKATQASADFREVKILLGSDDVRRKGQATWRRVSIEYNAVF